jgi:hypothetical protein
VTEAYRQRDNKFTGKIYKVIVELKNMQKADGEAADKAVREGFRRKALSD